MDWARIMAYITGTVDQELLLRNEYLAADNRILKAQIIGRLILSDTDKITLAEIAQRLGRKAIEDVAKTMRDFSECNPLRVSEPQRGLELGFEEPVFGSKILIPQEQFLVYCPGDVGQYARPIHKPPTFI